MKRIDLFQLMNAFQDEEFEPEEECFVDRNKVKETVLTQVRQKKRKGRKVLVLAAALAACLALIGWTYGEKIYPLLTTVDAAIGNGSETVYISAGSYENGGNGIIELEEGRLWFLVEGQRLDITDQVDEKTPYVWTRWERNGDLHYVLVGGTPEDYGWAEGIKFARRRRRDRNPPQPGGYPLGGVHSGPGLVRSGLEPGGGTVGVTKRIKHAAGCGGPRPVFAHGRPGVLPLQFYKNIFEFLDGRVLDPPLRHIRKPSIFIVGAGPRPARGRGTPQGGFSRPSADSPSAPPLRLSRKSSEIG